MEYKDLCDAREALRTTAMKHRAEGSKGEDGDRFKARKRTPQHGINTEVALVEEEAKGRCEMETNYRDMDEKRFALEKRCQECERLEAMRREDYRHAELQQRKIVLPWTWNALRGKQKSA